MKITGSQWSAFCKAIPDVFYFEDDDSPSEFQPDEVFEVTGGYIAWQGRGASDGNDQEYVVPGIITTRQVRAVRDREGIPLLPAFRRWLLLQTTTTVVVEVPNDQVQRLAEFLKTIKGKVVK